MKKRYTLEQKRWDDPVQHAMPPHTRVPAEFTVGGVRIAPATVLAPMAGVTDTVFRRFIKNASLFTAEANPTADVAQETSNQLSGCGLIMTEFTSADGLARMRETKRKRYLTYYDDEHPISAQLFGSNPETLAESARIVQDAGFDLVDLNLGCPAKRVVACNGGSGLLRDLPQIRRIFEAVRAAVTIPFTVKFRMGWNDAQIVCVELARMAEECGLNAVALHARTREDGYTGQARWEYIAAVKDAVRIPVIGNGDIRTPEDAAAMVDRTGCDAVMIGRAAPSNPWIFRQIAQYTATGNYDVPSNEDRYRMIRTYFQMLVDEIALEEQAEAARAAAIVAAGQIAREQRHRDAVGKMKQFASWFTHGVPGGGALRKQIFEARRGTAVLDAVEAFFAAQPDPGEAPETPAQQSEDTPDALLTSLGAYCD
ncbi:MAG: tRNA dihydrouridine synthase DusB [Acidobacteriota bacterium]|nr:tRNA dihydrouridine synthase DusB [Acidobacteriota bacterium]